MYKRENNSNIEVIKKTVELLNYLASKDTSSKITEVANALEMPKSTVHRILTTLCTDNVVIKTEHAHYRVGPTTLLWSSGYRFSSGIIDIARPWLERLRDESRETVHLSVYVGGSAQYADRFDSPQTVVLRWSRLGTRLPLYCTAAGRSILASLPSDELDHYLATTSLERRTERTTTDPEELRAMLSRFRVQGYAEENQENEENIRCVGAAILNRQNYPVAAISLTAPSFRFGDEDAAKYGQIIAKTARDISSQI